MSTNQEILFHLAELLILGIPLWWGAFRLLAILKDFPPHRHGSDVREITYPAGYDPGSTVRLNGGGNGKAVL